MAKKKTVIIKELLTTSESDIMIKESNVVFVSKLSRFSSPTSSQSKSYWLPGLCLNPRLNEVVDQTFFQSEYRSLGYRMANFD